MAKKKSNNGEWFYEGKPLTEAPIGYEGIIYVIYNRTKDKKYVGRKSFYSYSKKKLTPAEKLLPENKRKTFKITKTNTTWQSYTGSCSELNADIKAGDIIEKVVLRLCETRKEMTVWECKYIFCDCILEDWCYNQNILGKLFKADFNLK